MPLLRCIVEEETTYVLQRMCTSTEGSKAGILLADLEK